jgi:hypothetical protein
MPECSSLTAVFRIKRGSAVPLRENQLQSLHAKENIMKKLWAVFLAIFLAGLAVPASSGEFGDLRPKLSAARESLVTMMLHKDQRGPGQQKLVKDTADAVSAQLAKMKAPAGKEAQFKELVETWAAFKKTREAELVPVILKGNDEEAKKIAGGVQKERITKCQNLINELDN